MPVPVRIFLALLIVVGSAYAGLRILTADVNMPDGSCDSISVFDGATGMSLDDVGGDGAYTSETADACIAQARDDIRWALLPAALGLLALVYAGRQFELGHKAARRRNKDLNPDRV